MLEVHTFVKYTICSSRLILTVSNSVYDPSQLINRNILIIKLRDGLIKVASLNTYKTTFRNNVDLKKLFLTLTVNGI